MASLPPIAVGLGLRPEIAGDLLAQPQAVDFVEVVAENCLAQAAIRREAIALSERWAVLPHGVKLSLGSADGVEVERARALGRLARELRAPLVSEHVAITRGGRRSIGHLTPPPRTREALRALARNVAAARRHLPDVPLLLENIACTLRWPDDAMDEGDFYGEVVAATGCALLLDLSNLYANARNAGRDPLALLLAFPLERVAMVHLAGGVLEQGFYFDNHAAPVPDDAFALLAALVERIGPVPVLIERDANFPPFGELAAEADRARAILAEAGAASAVPRTAPREPAALAPFDAGEAARLSAAQEGLAALLTEPALPAETLGFDRDELRRTRGVLHRKRVEEALPLLPRLSRVPDIGALASAAVHAHPRAPSAGALLDALRIGQAAQGEPRLVAAATLDLLLLRARLRGPDDRGVLQPRRGPFVGRVQLPDGGACWAVKGFGAEAPVRLWQRP